MLQVSLVILKPKPGILKHGGGIKKRMWMCVVKESYLGFGNNQNDEDGRNIMRQKKLNMEMLINVEYEWSESIGANKVEGAVRIIEVEEVQCVVNQMKIRKASGPSGVAI